MAITDDKLYFSKVQALTVSEVSDYYLDVKAIAEFGKGSQLYINIDVCTAFTSWAAASSAPLDIYLCTSTGAPTSADRIAAVSINYLTATGAANAGPLCTIGKKVKVPLPSIGLLDHIGLHYQEVTAQVAGAVNAYLTLG